MGTPVVCAPLDDCHLAGVCDPGTGTCSHPLKPNGEPCSDGNACTQGDACIDGVCAPGTPVVCPAKSGCHDVGVCNPVDGTCSEPVKTDGVSCDDANACTRTDSCSAGTCQGGNPVVCVAKDACHDVGTCNTADGKCSDPVKPDGTTCPGGTCVSGVCVPGEADAGVAGDAGADAPADPGIGGGGCGCRMAPSPSRAGLAGLVFVAFAVLRRRARRPAPLDEFR